MPKYYIHTIEIPIQKYSLKRKKIKRKTQNCYYLKKLNIEFMEYSFKVPHKFWINS